MGRIGPRMAEALKFIQDHPGSNLRAIYRGVGLYEKPFGARPTPVSRLIDAGLAYDLQTGYGEPHAIYAWADVAGERDPEMYPHP